jgi:hypothetical protein
MWVQQQVAALLEQGQYLPIRSITDFSGFPQLQGIRWSSYLLQSIIRRFGKTFRVIDKGFADHRYVDAALVPADSPLLDLSSLIEHIWRDELGGVSPLTLDKLTGHLRTKGIIAKVIPQSAFRSQRICLDAAGAVTLAAQE